jgi:mannitol-1-phosphate 5-dehydrogenase
MRDQSARSILIFGAGNIGRSFVGQIFGRGGYAPIFADVDGELVDALNRDGSYVVVHRSPDGSESRLTVPGVAAVRADRPEEVAPVLRTVPLVATSVGAAVLPRILPLLTAEAVRRRDAGEAPFDLILAENIHGGGEMVRQAMVTAMPPGSTNDYYEGSTPRGGMPGVIECSVGKMVPIVPEELRRREPTTVYAEAFNTLLVDADGWTRELPAVPELRPVRPIGAWVDRKLYIHNLGHAATAYLGFLYRPGITFIREAVADPAVRDVVRTVMTAAGEGLRREYPGVFADADIAEHIEDLLYRFGSPTLGDTVFRVGRDLRRKLAAGDRITGALRLLEKHHLDTTPIEEVYRGALRFRGVDEAGRMYPEDERFLAELESSADPAALVAAVSGFDPDADAELLARLV